MCELLCRVQISLSSMHANFHPALLDTQLKLFGTCISQLELRNPSISEIMKYFRDISPVVWSSMSEVCILLNLILVWPAKCC